MHQKIYLEHCFARLFIRYAGNPDGRKILFLHGGPGIGCKEADFRFFDLSKDFVILLDQRGCGLSSPQPQLDFNNTDQLVSDINVVLDHFNIDKVILFGGSWGSTLALIYAIRHPHRVVLMILRGIFLATKRSRFDLECGNLRLDLMHAWEDLITHYPGLRNEEVAPQIWKDILSENEALSKTATMRWHNYGNAIMGHRKAISDIGDLEDRALNIAKIEAHYSVNDFFIPDNYILDHIETIASTPSHIVHGIHDEICAVWQAEELAKAMKNAQLHLVDGGHLDRDPVIEKSLKEIVNF